MSKLNDLTGRRFGALTVIERDPARTSGDAFWICRCSRCGEMKSIRGVYLTGPRAYQDCGCAWAERNRDLTGEQIGTLRVAELLPDRRGGQKRYRTVCSSCGREAVKTQNSLLSGKKCSCQEARHQFDPEQIARKFVNGASVSAAMATEPLPTSRTGYRWVRWYPRNRCYCATFRVAGVRYFKYGFTTPDAAYRWALAEHTRAAIEAGIEIE